VRTLYEQQDDFLKILHPTPRPPADMAGLEFTWTNGSRIQGLPSGAEQVRLYHPYCLFFDEAVYLDDFLGSYGAAEPVATQIIAVSSAGPSDFGDIVLRVMDKARKQDFSRDWVAPENVFLSSHSVRLTGGYARAVSTPRKALGCEWAHEGQPKHQRLETEPAPAYSRPR
jgi:hypothetical protein